MAAPPTRATVRGRARLHPAGNAPAEAIAEPRRCQTTAGGDQEQPGVHASECRSLTGAVTILTSPPLRRLPLPDTSSHDVVGLNACARTRAGLDARVAAHLVFAICEALGAVDALMLATVAPKHLLSLSDAYA